MLTNKIINILVNLFFFVIFTSFHAWNVTFQDLKDICVFIVLIKKGLQSFETVFQLGQ